MHSFATAEPITLEIRNAAGDVRVDLGDTRETKVEVTVVPGGPLGLVDDIVRAFGGRRPEGRTEPDADRRSRWWEGPVGSEATEILQRVRVEMTHQDDGATLVVDTDPATRGWRTAFAIRITAPQGSGIRIASQSADVTISGTAGRLDVRTASGDVVAGDVTEAAQVHTASGDIRLQSVGGDLSCRSASGGIEATAIGGAAMLHTTSGDVRVQAPAGDVEVRTVSGTVRIADVTAGLTQITAVSGDVEIGIHPGSLASVDLTSLTGDTRSDLTVTDEPAGSDESGGPASASTDDGEDAPAAVSSPLLAVRVRTTSGDIRLRRAVAA